MKILLTGATGFIGSYCLKYSRYKEALVPFSFQHDDIAHFDFSTIDTIIHLAALVHQMEGADPTDYERINVTKTVQLARKAKENGVKHFIFMSTVKVYGEESDTIYTETTPPHPQDDYGKSKLSAEQELLKLQDDHFKISIIRTPIVYGYGVKANIKNLITLVQNIPLIPLGGIHNQRSMVYIGNLSHLIDTVIEKKANGIFLASDDAPISTTKLIQKMAKALKVKRYLIILPFFSYLLKKIKPSFYQRLYGSLKVDNSRTKQQLNFHNPYSTDEGIEFMIQGQQ